MKTVTAKDIMHKNVFTVPDDMPVHELANFFTTKMISGAPVVDKEGKLIGVVSVSDIVRNDSVRAAIMEERHLADYYLQGWEDTLNDDELKELHVEENDTLLVRDIMTPLIFKVDETTTMNEMADTMINGRIHRLIVTRNSKVAGIITTLDLLKAIRTYTREDLG